MKKTNPRNKPGLIERIAPRNRVIVSALAGLRRAERAATVRELAALYGLSAAHVRRIAPLPRRGRKKRSGTDPSAERGRAICRRLEQIGPMPFGLRGSVIDAVAKEFHVGPGAVWRYAPRCWKGKDRWAARKGRRRRRFPKE